jgi:hypothetical protein
MQPVELMAHAAWLEYYARLSARVAYPVGEGRTVHDSKYVKSFMTIGQLCLERGYDPRDFVSVTLPMICKDPRFIVPKDLLRPEIIAMYGSDLARRNNQGAADDNWKLQEASVLQMRALRPDLYTTLYDVLVSSWHSFDSWFRVMYPQPMHPKLLELYGRLAYEDLQRDPGVRHMLYRRRPDNMRVLQEQHGFFGDVATDRTTG